MKKILLASLLLSAALFVSAQPSFTVEGPKTINDLEAKNTNVHYTFFKFSNNSVVAFADSNSGNWDIAFKGTTIILNGGNSGPSTVAGQVVSGSFVTTEALPVTGYNTDNATTKAIPTGSGNGWYTYNPSLHLITPTADRVIAIQLANGDYVKLEILSYYQGAPQNPDYMTSVAGVYSFRYQISSANNGFSSMNTRITNLRANMADYQYFNLSEGDTLLTAEATGTGWDIAFKNTTILVNSGTSGTSTVSAQVVSADYDTYFTAPSADYNVDGTIKAIPTGSDNGWYNYNPSTHAITALPNKTIVIKTASGKYVKLKVESYYNVTNPATSAYYTFSYFYQPYFSDDLKTDASNTTTSVFGSSATEVLVYPQPLSSDAQVLRIEGSSATQAEVMIYNTLGELVYTTKMNEGIVELSGWNKKAGCYVLKCTAGDQVSSQRIVIQ